jgi:hypothetical protein
LITLGLAPYIVNPPGKRTPEPNAHLSKHLYEPTPHHNM